MKENVHTLWQLPLYKLKSNRRAFFSMCSLETAITCNRASAILPVIGRWRLLAPFVLSITTKQAAGELRKKQTNQPTNQTHHRTTPNPAHQRADGLDPTKQADQNQRKLVSNLEARLNKASRVIRIPIKTSFEKERNHGSLGGTGD